MVWRIMWPVERLHTELRHYRLRRTHPRDEVYRTLGLHGPIGRAELARHLSGEVGVRTVYRTIRAFINTQVARELPGGLIELISPFMPRRDYILCRSCGRRTPFWDPGLERKLRSILADRQYVLPAYQLELSGLCNLCAEQI